MIALCACNLVTGEELTPTLGATSSPTAIPEHVTPTTALLSSSAGRIAYYSTTASGGNRGISVINTDGSSLTLLVVSGLNPNWSPDGGQIAFEASHNGKPAIYLMNIDSSQQTYLTDMASSSSPYPVWSPDGQQIVFEMYDGYHNIYIINIDGSGLRPLTDPGLDAQRPTWSPNDQQVAFIYSSEHHTPFKIATVAVNDSGDWHILAEGIDPVWSPNSQQIAFFSGLDDQLYLMNADGSNQKRLTNTGQIAPALSPPSWSLDGEHIAFVSRRDGNAEIYTINADGSGEMRLTDNPADDQSPAWSPDGRQIAFVSNRDGNREIYVMSADGSNQTRLTNNTIDDWGPVWQPQP
jgi:TolB protein